jgi:hypothetical protein
MNGREGTCRECGKRFAVGQGSWEDPQNYALAGKNVCPECKFLRERVVDMSDWISVKDELPGLWEVAWVHFEGRKLLDDGRCWTEWSSEAFAWRVPVGWCHAGVAGEPSIVRDDVTHWHRLPKWEGK